MKVAMLFVAVVLFLGAGGYVWHLYKPLPFLEQEEESPTPPAVVGPAQESGEGDELGPLLGNTSPTEEAALPEDGGGSTDGEEGDDFSIEIISEPMETGSTQ